METENITLDSVREDLKKLKNPGGYDNLVIDFAKGRRSLYIGRSRVRSDQQQQQLQVVAKYCIAMGHPLEANNFVFSNTQDGQFMYRSPSGAYLSSSITLDQAIEIIEKDLATTEQNNA